MKPRIPSLLVGLLLLSLTSGCVSRIRQDLYMTLEDQQSKVKVEDTMLVKEVQLGDPYAETKLIRGSANCVIMTTSSRGERLKTDFSKSLFLGYDENIRCKIFIELPEPIQTETLDLVDRSLVQLLGRYEQAAESKIFLASDGELIIDSVIDKSMFAHLKGAYKNQAGNVLEYQGEFRVKIEN